MNEKPKYYQAKLHWVWGMEHSFSETTEFTLYNLEEIDAKVKDKLVKIARRYAMDCDKPMRVWVTGLDVIPVYENTYYNSSDMGWNEYLDNEAEYTRELVENKNLYTESGNYNLTISPKNK